MKLNFTLNKLAFVSLILMGFLSLSSLAQNKTQGANEINATLLPNGMPASEEALNPSALTEYIFGGSGSSPFNVLVLNGVSVPLLNQGWFKEDGEHLSGNVNYISGTLTDLAYRSFYGIDLSNLGAYGITAPITTAELRLQQWSSEPTSGTQYIGLSAVSTPWALLDLNYSIGDPNGVAIFDDIASGNFYGDFNIDRSLPGSNVIAIPLNGAALSDLNAAIGGTFVIGGVSDNIAPPPPPAVPVSNWAIILAALSIIGFFTFRSVKKIA